jgi:iron only hydrogenase large subunit-like protein
VEAPGLAVAKRLLRAAFPVAASVAPSFVAHFGDDEREKLPSALKALGFRLVEPTNAVLPEIMQMRASAERSQHTVQISACCPKVVRIVREEYPHVESLLSRVPSPATWHSRRLRSRLGSGASVVFFSPCVHKAYEASLPENEGAADAVVTFEQLSDWLSEQNAWRHVSDSGFDAEPPFWTYMALLVSDAAGSECSRRLLENAANLAPGFYEVLGCPGGCLGGSGVSSRISIPERIEIVMRHQQKLKDAQNASV